MVAVSTETSQSGMRTRRWLRRLIVLGLLAAPMTWFGRFAYRHLTLEPTPRQEYWDQRYEAVVPPRPGALGWLEAGGSIRKRPWLISGSYDADLQAHLLLRGEWDATLAPFRKADNLFRSPTWNQDADAVRQAFLAGWNRPPGRWYGPSFFGGQFHEIEEWVEWLLAHSRWALEEEFDPESAAKDWLAVMHAAADLRRKRTVETVFSAGRIEQSLARELILAAHEHGDPVRLPGLPQRFSETGNVESPPELLAGERIALLAALDQIYVREGGDWLHVPSAVSAGYWNLSRGGATPSKLWSLAAPVFHDIATARASVEECFTAVQGLACITQCNQARTAGTGRPDVGPGVLDGLSTYGIGFYVRDRKSVV